MMSRRPLLMGARASRRSLPANKRAPLRVERGPADPNRFRSLTAFAFSPPADILRPPHGAHLEPCDRGREAGAVNVIVHGDSGELEPGGDLRDAPELERTRTAFGGPVPLTA